MTYSSSEAMVLRRQLIASNGLVHGSINLDNAPAGTAGSNAFLSKDQVELEIIARNATIPSITLLRNSTASNAIRNQTLSSTAVVTATSASKEGKQASLALFKSFTPKSFDSNQRNQRIKSPTQSPIPVANERKSAQAGKMPAESRPQTQKIVRRSAAPQAQQAASAALKALGNPQAAGKALQASTKGVTGGNTVNTAAGSLFNTLTKSRTPTKGATDASNKAGGVFGSNLFSTTGNKKPASSSSTSIATQPATGSSSVGSTKKNKDTTSSTKTSVKDTKGLSSPKSVTPTTPNGGNKKGPPRAATTATAQAPGTKTGSKGITSDNTAADASTSLGSTQLPVDPSVPAGGPGNSIPTTGSLPDLNSLTSTLGNQAAGGGALDTTSAPSLPDLNSLTSTLGNQAASGSALDTLSAPRPVVDTTAPPVSETPVNDNAVIPGSPDMSTVPSVVPTVIDEPMISSTPPETPPAESKEAVKTELIQPDSGVSMDIQGNDGTSNSTSGSYIAATGTDIAASGVTMSASAGLQASVAAPAAGLVAPSAAS